jgi:hypothetical protein
MVVRPMTTSSALYERVRMRDDRPSGPVMTSDRPTIPRIEASPNRPDIEQAGPRGADCLEGQQKERRRPGETLHHADDERTSR